MKRFFAVALTLALLVGLLTLPVLARDAADVVRDALRNQILFDDMYFLCETVDQGAPDDVFSAVLTIYPDVVAVLKHNLDEGSGMLASDDLGLAAADEIYRDAVYYLFRSDVFFDGLCRLTEVIQSGDNYALGAAMAEVYPDWIVTLKKGMESQRLGGTSGGGATDDVPADKDDADTDIWMLIVTGVAGAALGAATVWLVMRLLGKSKKNRGNML